MLFVTDHTGKNTVTIDEDMKVAGKSKEFKTIIENEVKQIDPEGNHAPNVLAFLYYSLDERGFNVEAQPGDLTTEDLPKGAVS